MLFTCDGRIGLCCVYVVFLVTYSYEFINVAAYEQEEVQQGTCSD